MTGRQRCLNFWIVFYIVYIIYGGRRGRWWTPPRPGSPCRSCSGARSISSGSLPSTRRASRSPAIPPGPSLQRRQIVSIYFLVNKLYQTKITWSVLSNRVISSPFSHRTFFSTKFHEGTLYFFLAVNSLKKWFRCWHGHFWPWLTSKPLFFYSSSGDEITLLEGNFVSHLQYISGLKHEFEPLQVISSAGNFFVKNLGNPHKVIDT